MTASERALPDDLKLMRTTAEFDQDSVPAGLLRDHQVAPGVWGLLVVREGSVGFRFEDEPENLRMILPGSPQPIPPQRKHRVVLEGPCRFVVEFYAEPT